ncbi:Crp/Fnr family transcriptional regulator [Rhodobium gokarnense]|uniref:CRP-like cAMP-binding protein n=1 Tax=Rhodobium gokarnense TaxID=364296 RepID=A0ABT3HET7_9HYPH|nr:Crp/Fnr family transcriptional regulator [Rhodobium gokarnense]MCW2308916.1 CRP-like cAMP-binding protein [Rhodobium gokarnense]
MPQEEPDRLARSVTAGHDCPACPLAGCSFRAVVAEAAARRTPRPQHQYAISRGERIIEDGPSCKRIWVVVKGLVALATVLPDGRRQITDLSAPGDVICPVGAVIGAESWVEALGASIVCQVALGDLMALNGHAHSLMAGLFRHTHRQLERHNGNMVMLGRFDGMERVWQFLVEITRRLGRQGVGGYRVDLPMSREDIADYLGLNSETVSRLFSRIRKTRLVTFISPTEFIVHDLAALERRLPTAGQPTESLFGRILFGWHAADPAEEAPG